ncbi:MAG: helix-turn-helix domain-containing protein [Bacteroidota bacterium]|nr:helix-turn-helix domain-containing protein [Bacteroidota bacterium]MDQ6904781.1 helix-turn-helix domain-containing protein [Bacteroidota bacterium]
MKINTNSQYHTALAKIESFIEKKFENLTKPETEELRRLSISVEEYEAQKYPMPLQAGIKEILEHYMFEKKINKSRLAEELELPNSTLSEILNGKKKINLSIARKLHQKLKIDGNFLLEVA